MNALVKLSDIEMDHTIQCRAALDTTTVNEYAERMTAGDKFPPVELFRNGAARCYIGDGWHRIMSAQQIGALTIEATVYPGARAEALMHALGANKTGALKRTSADKHRCVEVALREFPTMSSRVIAEKCGVGDQLVRQLRDSRNSDEPASKTTGKDGKQYPAKKAKKKTHGKPKKTKKAKAMLSELDAAESRGASLLCVYIRTTIAAIKSQTEFSAPERVALRSLGAALAGISS